MRRYQMPARTPEQVKAEPAANDGERVPGAPITRSQVDRAFGENVADEVTTDINYAPSKPVIKPTEDGWLM